ncbi:MAG: phosphoglycerate kinase [Patescibacteria group bacterium]
MLNLPKLSDFDLKGKRVILRVDIDVPFEKTVNETGASNYKIVDFTRINTWKPTVKYLLQKEVEQVILIGHIGRPLEEGKDKISTFAIKIPDLALSWWPDNLKGDGGPLKQQDGEPKVNLLENLRFYEGEESNDPEFAKKLASFGDFYINEAFADSHRSHASIVGIPKLLPHAAGFHLASEIENLSKVLSDPKKPTLLVISGVKEDKVEMIKKARAVFDRVLVGGRLPEYLGEDYADPKILVAKLNPDKEDITLNSIEAFEKEIASAGTIVLAGVPGKYEEPGQTLGTERIFKSVASSSAFKIVGGGDSLAVVSKYDLSSKFDWISVGGGAMLEFLIAGTLPGIEILLH